MTEDRESSGLAVHDSADMTPASASLVALDAVGFAFGCKKERAVRAVPAPIAAKTESTVIIVEQGERTGGSEGGSACLLRDKIKHPIGIRLCVNAVNAHFPMLVQRYPWLGRSEINKAVSRFKPTMYWAAPELIQRHELDSPFAIAHVPEIRMAALEFGLCPWKPNAMVMLVVGWIIIRHQPA